VVGLLKREGEIIRKTFIPFMIYGVVVGLMAYLLLASGIRGILTI
jgi:lactate permease